MNAATLLRSSPNGGHWFLGVTNAEETLQFAINEDPCVGTCLGVLGQAGRYTYTDFGRTPRMAPHPDDVPAEGLSLASLEALWNAYGDPTYASLPVEYGIHLWEICAPDCEVGTLYVFSHGEHTSEHRPDASGRTPALVWDSSWRQSWLFTDDEDPSLAIMEIDAGTEFGFTPMPTVPPPQPPAPRHSGGLLSMSIFPATLPQAGGVGAVALLVGVLYAAWPLIKGAGFGLFSRIDEDQVLANPRRARLVQVVQANPGIHFSELRRLGGLSNGAAVHHLRVLTKAGHVRRVPVGGFTCYFPGGPGRVVPVTGLVKSDGARRVLQAIQSTPGLSNLQVAHRTGLDPGTVHYHVKRLHAAGLVTAQRHGREVHLRPVATA